MMDIEIQTQRENKLLDRTEVRFLVHHGDEATPTRDDVRRALADDLDADVDTLVLHRLASEFGRGRSEGYAKLYPSQDKAVETERHYVLVRNGLAAAETSPSSGGQGGGAEEPEEPPAADEGGDEAEAEDAPEDTEEAED